MAFVEGKPVNALTPCEVERILKEGTYQVLQDLPIEVTIEMMMVDAAASKTVHIAQPMRLTSSTSFLGASVSCLPVYVR